MTIVMLRRKGLGKTSCSKIEEYSIEGIKTFRNDMLSVLDTGDILIRWGCTSTFKADKVFNRAGPIHKVCNKTSFRQLLMKEDPETTPVTWFDKDEWVKDCVSFNEQDWSLFPKKKYIVRPQKHSQGKQVYLVDKAPEQFFDAVEKCGPHWYASEYIEKVAEYRITFCQGRVVWIANKIPSNPEDIAWNVAQGGKFENIKWGSWPTDSIRIASRAFALSDLDFGAVDIMVDGDGRPYVLEINSAPSMTSEYRQRCMAKAFDWMVSEKEIQPMGKGPHYTDFIHPAMLIGAET